MRTLHIGLGPIGLDVIRIISATQGFTLSGAADISPGKAGRRLEELVPLSSPSGVIVEADAAKMLERVKAEVAVITTFSSLEKALPLIRKAVSCGVNVISSCEELSYPWKTHPEEANALDELAKRKGVTLLSTGVNPGFLMDYLPLVLTGVCAEVKGIEVERVQDASLRREPFRKKIGAGLSREGFEKCRQRGGVGHAGLTESAQMLAAGMGWEAGPLEQTMEPVCEGGMVKGIFQTARGTCRGGERISLFFRATLGEKEPHDRIVIEGTPPLEVVIRGGVSGDTATCAHLVNCIPAVVKARPGLITMIDLVRTNHSYSVG